MTETYSLRQYAKRLGASANTVLLWIRDGQLRALNLAVRPGQRARYRITIEEAARFEASRMTGVSREA